MSIFVYYFFISNRFASNTEYSIARGHAPVSRMKQSVNNNGDLFLPPQTVVVQQGRRVKSSLQQHEQQQEELFEL